MQAYTSFNPFGKELNVWLDSILLDKNFVMDSLQLTDTTSRFIFKGHQRQPQLSLFPQADSVVYYLIKAKFHYRKTMNGSIVENQETPFYIFSTQYFFSDSLYTSYTWTEFRKEHRKKIGNAVYEGSATRGKKENYSFHAYSYKNKNSMLPIIRTLFRKDQNPNKYIFTFDINFVY